MCREVDFGGSNIYGDERIVVEGNLSRGGYGGFGVCLLEAILEARDYSVI